MRRLLVVVMFLATFFLAVNSARADQVQYLVTSTYSAGTQTTAFSAPNATFTFTFTEPSNVLSSLVTSVPLEFSLGAGTPVSESGQVQYFDSTGGGLFTISFTDGSGNTYYWDIFGPVIFSGTGAPYTLLTGVFPINGTGMTTSALYLNNTSVLGNFQGGTVTATDISAPEPGSLLLLASGLLSIAFLLRRVPPMQLRIQGCAR